MRLPWRNDGACLISFPGLNFFQDNLISDAEGEFVRHFGLYVSGEIPGCNALDYYPEAPGTSSNNKNRMTSLNL
jgi:hypothetical protein